MKLPFPLRSGKPPFQFMGDARLLNCFPEKIGQENPDPIGFLAVPGQAQFSAVAGVPCRGAIAVEELDRVFSLHGATLYSVESDGTATSVGSVPGSLPAIMERGPQRFAQKEVTITIASPAVIFWPNHNLPVGAKVVFSTDGALPDGLDGGTTYYVISAGMDANHFEVSATSGGSAVNTSGQQSGTQTAIRGDGTYQVAIVSDHAAYVLEDGVIYYVDLPEEPNSVTYLDGLWVYGCDSGRFYYSALNDARTIDSLSYETAEARPDGLVRAIADRGELWLLGTKTVEIYTGSGDATEPFQQLGGTFIDQGCGSKMSVASFDNALHWLGNDGIVYRGAGYQKTRVSDHPLERAIAAVSDKTTIRAFVFTDRGHSFYVLTCDAWTWALDQATGAWFELASYRRPDWRAWPYVRAWEKHIVGDKASGDLNELSADITGEAGRPIRMELVFPDMSAYPNRLIFSGIDFDADTGVGLGGTADGDAGYDPQLMLDWSDDGGATWAPERWASLGTEGNRRETVHFGQLGTSRKKGRRFRVACADPVVKSIYLGDVQARPTS